jgi:hypothetical protein
MSGHAHYTLDEDLPEGFDPDALGDEEDGE